MQAAILRDRSLSDGGEASLAPFKSRADVVERLIAYGLYDVDMAGEEDDCPEDEIFAVCSPRRDRCARDTCGAEHGSARLRVRIRLIPAWRS